jgi:acyl-CoA dehydrogenase
MATENTGSAENGGAELESVAEGAGILERAKAVAEVAGYHADSVDRGARFPIEALTAARRQRLLGVLVPTDLGGESSNIREVAEICFLLGRGCASAAMIFAMHQIKMACLIRHGWGNRWQRTLQRRIASEQLLLASSTTEGTGGGNVRASEAPIRSDGNHITLERAASVISYGANADGIVTTARRSEASAPSDQVLVVFTKDNYSLEQTNSWDALGMRGTCSAGFLLRARGEADQVIPNSYELIHKLTMVPVAHLLWSSVWTGIAAGAVQRARAFVRNAMRSPGAPLPPAASHLTRARASLDSLRARVHAGIALFEQNTANPELRDSIGSDIAMNLLKVETSEMALTTVMSALRACGLSGYRNDSEFSLSRHIRDILSSPIMINNDRIISNSGASVLLNEVPDRLID